MVVIAIGLENYDETDIDTVTYGTKTCLKAVDIPTGTSGNMALSEIWYILEADLPSDGDNDVVISVSATIWVDLELQAAAMTLENVDQTAPDATATKIQTSTGDISTDITPLVDNSWLIDALTQGNSYDPTVVAPQTERYDYQYGSSAFSVSTNEDVAASPDSMGWTKQSGNRDAHVVIAIAPASSGPASSGTATSTSIDCDSVYPAEVWDDLSWNDTEDTGDIKYKVKYWGSGWLSGWDQRIKLTIDETKVDTANLTDFPILVYVSAASGIGDVDASCVFDEVGANSKKIAVTSDDGETELEVEIENWDDGNEKAWLWVKVPTVTHATDTDLYLYYDVDHADNDTYVGDTNTDVWDTNFQMVQHMDDDPDTSTTQDSTTNNNDGAKKGAGEPAETASGKIDEAQDYDGSDDYIDLGDDPVLWDSTGPVTVSMWANLDAYIGEDYPNLINLKTDQAAGFVMFCSNSTSPSVMTGVNYGSFNGISTDFVQLRSAGDISGSLVGVWNYITLVYDGGGRTLDSSYTLYVNDAAQGQATNANL